MDAQHRRLRWTSFINLALKGSAILMALASQIVLARCMSAENFGIYAIVVACTTLLSVLSGAGMSLAAIRFLPRYRRPDSVALFRGFVWYALLLSLAGSSLIMAGFIVAGFLDILLSDHFESAIAGAPLVLLLCLASLATGLLQAMQQPLRAEIFSNVLRPAGVALLVAGYAWLVSVPGSATALMLTCIATVAALIPALIAALRTVPNGLRAPRDTADRRLWLRSGFAFLVPLAVMSLVERLDIILLGTLVGAADAGTYTVGSRLAQMVGLAIASVNALLGPMAAQLIGRQDRLGLQRLLANGALLNSSFAIVIASVLVVAGPRILMLFGSNFAVAAPAMEILVLGQIAQAGLGAAGAILMLAGHNRIVIMVMIAAVFVHLLLCLLLIPSLGQVGAALATASTTAGLSLVLAVVAANVLDVDTSLRGGLLSLVASWRRADATRKPAP